MPEVTPGANAPTPEANAVVVPATPEKPEDNSGADKARLLAESKAWKARALAAEKEKEEAEKAKLTEQGKYKDLFEKAQTELSEFRTKHVETRKRAEVERLAASVGCVSVDALYTLGNKTLLEYDAESDTIQGAEKFIEEAKKVHQFLFNPVKAPNVNPASPGGAKAPLSYMEEIKQAKTQAEFEAIRKKHGRE